jgi:cyclic pyranopterin phosphate synthase
MLEDRKDMSDKKLSHIDSAGKANMVNVADKPDMYREAVASGFIKLDEQTIDLINNNTLKKGDVLTVAEIAGIQAAKKTSDLIPLCHPLYITKIDVECTIKPDGVYVESRVICTGKTGVEMEALTAVSTALLTIYDMCKAVDKEMVISDIKLVNKEKRTI